MGGEPTIHPDFIKLVTRARELGFREIEVISNGSRLVDVDFFKRSLAAGLTRISISLHSPNAEMESLLLGGLPAQAFRNKLIAIRHAVRAHRDGLLEREVAVNAVVTKLNYLQIPKLLSLVARLGVRSFRLNYLQPEGNTTKRPQEITLRYVDFRPYLAVIIHRAETLGIRLNFEAIPWCVSGLSYQDYLKYCEAPCDRTKNKISTDDLDGITRRPMGQRGRRLELKSHVPACSSCVHADNCEGVWRRYLDIFGSVEFQP